MSSSLRVLYVSQNGMLENLGQSQVLPYLRGLAKRGIEFELISYELPDADSQAIEEQTAALAASGISWTPLRRRRDPRLRVKLAESALGVVRTLALMARRKPDIVQGRSYFATAVADAASTIGPHTRLLFDCRGLIGDEYVDTKRWTRDRIEFKLVKHYERRAFRRAAGVVVLTEAVKRWIAAQGMLGGETAVEVIPCCVDLEKFAFARATRDRVRAELGLAERLVVVYSGTLGSFYREPEMARFAGIVRRRARRPCTFLLLTPSSPNELVALLEKQGFTRDEIIARRVAPTRMADYLSAGDIGLSFIISTFSKIASSPTKVAEYLGCGLPVVLNGDIGDQRDLSREKDACVVLESFAEEELVAAAAKAIERAARPLEERAASSRRVARAHFDLETVGVARYARLYETMLGRS